MTFRAAYCAASEAVESSLAHPGALVAYVAASVTLSLIISLDAMTLVLSHFANLMLILIAAAQYRKARTMEREIDGIAEATDGVDHEAIRRETA